MVDPREVLERDVPGLVVDDLRRIGEGWDHAAFLVNGTVVFRLPWQLLEPDGATCEPPSALGEIALLRAVAGRLPVAVPEPLYVPDHGRYFGYRHLPGPSLADLLAAGSWRWDGARPLTDLVVEVVTAVERAVPVADALALGVPPATAPRHREAEQRALRSGRLTAEVRAVAEAAALALPGQWAGATARPLATLHADLGLDHWLAGDDRSPRALIDWSDCCVGPPELQLATLMWHEPELTASVARAYAERTERRLDGDLVFGCGYANALGDVGELLAEDDGDDELEWCLEFLRRWSRPELAATLRGVRFGA